MSLALEHSMNAMYCTCLKQRTLLHPSPLLENKDIYAQISPYHPRIPPALSFFKAWKSYNILVLKCQLELQHNSSLYNIIINVKERSRSWSGDVRLHGGFEIWCCLALSYSYVLMRFPNDKQDRKFRFVRLFWLTMT